MLLAIELVKTKTTSIPHTLDSRNSLSTTFESAAFYRRNDLTKRKDEELHYHSPSRLGMPLPRPRRRRLDTSQEF